MRILFIAMFFTLLACRSETGLRDLEVSTQVEIKLPPDAIYGNIASFSGFHAAVPDLFIAERIEEINGNLIRKITLASQDVLIDELIEINDDRKIVKYRTQSTSLPIEEMTHAIEVKIISEQKCKVSWVSNILVQNQYRDLIDERITGVQESYLFSLELLGEELDDLLRNPDF